MLTNQIFRTVCLNSLVDYSIRSLPLPVLYRCPIRQTDPLP